MKAVDNVTEITHNVPKNPVQNFIIFHAAEF